MTNKEKARQEELLLLAYQFGVHTGTKSAWEKFKSLLPKTKRKKI